MKGCLGIVIAGVGVFLLAAIGAGGGSSNSAVRKTVEDAFQTLEVGLNNHDVGLVDPFFSTAGEGANPDGLQQTRNALRTFVTGLSRSDHVQFHDFSIKTVEVHDDARLAKVTYEVHVSVIRNSSQLAFGATITQNLALLKTPRGWRISGGDQAQLTDVQGHW